MSDSVLKKYEKITLALLVVLVIPMLLVAVYSRPFADDFGYSARTHQVWENSHSLVKLCGAIGDEVTEVYYSWQGSFSALALFALQPSVFGSKLYGLSTVILLGLFLFGTYYLFSKAFRDDRQIAMIVFAAVAIVSIETLPHAFQGFYWWNGASYYTLFYSLMLIQWGMLLDRKRMILPAILGFFLGGGNLVSGLLGLEVIFLFLAREVYYVYINRNDPSASKGFRIRFKGVIRVTVILICSLIGFVINVLAPGNAIRAVETVSETPIQAIGNSFLEAYNFFNEWINLPVMVLLMFLFPFIWHYAGEVSQGILGDLQKKKPPLVIYVVATFCLFASTFTPTLYSMNEVGPRRIQNIRFFVFIVFLVLLEMETCKRTRGFVEGRIYFAPGKERISYYLKGYMLVMLAGIIVILGINTLPRANRNNLTSIAATRSLLIGEAKRYAQARDEWTDILESDDKAVTLPAIHDHPVPIYYVEFDITGNPDDYRDLSMCKYYRKDQIILETE